MIQKYHNLSVAFGQIDLAEGLSISRKYNITGFPKFKLFSHGDYINYESEKTSIQFYNFILRQRGVFSTQINTKEDLEYFQQFRQNLVLTYFQDKVYSPPQYKALLSKVVDDFPQLIFLHTSNEELKEGVDFGEFSLIVRFFKLKDGTQFDYQYKTKIKEFLDFHCQEVVLEFGEKSVNEIFFHDKPGIILFMNNKNAQVEQIFRKTAVKQHEQITFTVCNTDEDKITCDEIGEYLGQTLMPEIFILQAIGFQKYKFSYDQITEEKLEEFIDDFFSYKLPVFLKSEVAPVHQQQLIKKAVSNNFQEMVIQNEKHAVVNFYSLKCEHSLRFNKLFRTIAKKFETQENLIFAEINFLKNEYQIPSFRISQYPTLYFFKSGQKESPILYDGEKTETQIIQFIYEKMMNEKENDL